MLHRLSSCCCCLYDQLLWWPADGSASLLPFLPPVALQAVLHSSTWYVTHVLTDAGISYYVAQLNIHSHAVICTSASSSRPDRVDSLLFFFFLIDLDSRSLVVFHILQYCQVSQLVEPHTWFTRQRCSVDHM